MREGAADGTAPHNALRFTHRHAPPSSCPHDTRAASPCTDGYPQRAGARRCASRLRSQSPRCWEPRMPGSLHLADATVHMMLSSRFTDNYASLSQWVDSALPLITFIVRNYPSSRSPFFSRPVDASTIRSFAVSFRLQFYSQQFDIPGGFESIRDIFSMPNLEYLEILGGFTDTHLPGRPPTRNGPHYARSDDEVSELLWLAPFVTTRAAHEIRIEELTLLPLSKNNKCLTLDPAPAIRWLCGGPSAVLLDDVSGSGGGFYIDKVDGHVVDFEHVERPQLWRCSSMAQLR
ncbi:hypothetical protein B0H19DRAFT_1235506 [Mycena capillaripes]|nr:hypothetical protein B0H19DRAFT_1235506 [Mycena capillaripes]